MADFKGDVLKGDVIEEGERRRKVVCFRAWDIVEDHIVPEKAADAPGTTELPEDFPPFPDTF